MYIGKLAELTGATRKAIRLYESMGLIPIPSRQGKYRVYTENDVMLVQMIRRAQEVGFHLSEMRELVALKAKRQGFPLTLANELIAKKRQAVRTQMEALRLLDHRLVELTGELETAFGERR